MDLTNQEFQFISFVDSLTKRYIEGRLRFVSIRCHQMLFTYDLLNFFFQFCFKSSAIFVIEINFIEWLDYNRQSLFQEFCNRCQEPLQVNWFLEKTSCANMQCKLSIFICDISSRDKNDWNITSLGVDTYSVNKTETIQFGHHN